MAEAIPSDWLHALRHLADWPEPSPSKAAQILSRRARSSAVAFVETTRKLQAEKDAGLVCGRPRP